MDDKSAYLLTIKETYPDLDIKSSRLHTAEGQFNDILFINGDLIFRFPRYEESISKFLQEVELLQKLRWHLPLPIPEPVYLSVGAKTVGRVFMGYKMLSGKPLLREVLNAITNQSTLDAFARQLANLLSQT